MVARDIKSFKLKKAVLTDDQLINTLKTKLSRSSKFLIKYLLLPWTRSSVGMREQSKSFMVWLTDVYRRAFQRLADQMVVEGRLPEADLIFFLRINEVEKLTGERDPLLVALAKQRKKAFQEMDKFRFGEITKGPLMRPLNVRFNDTAFYIGLPFLPFLPLLRCTL